jgi:hypothetical protein
MQLMSTGQIADHNYHVILDPDVCYIQDCRISHLVGTGPHRHDSQRLWEFDLLHLPSVVPVSPVSSTYATSSTSSLSGIIIWSSLWLPTIYIASLRSFRVNFGSRIFRSL